MAEPKIMDADTIRATEVALTPVKEERRVRISGPSRYNPSDQVDRLVTVKAFHKKWEADGFKITSWDNGEEYLSPDDIKARKAEEAEAKKKASETPAN